MLLRCPVEALCLCDNWYKKMGRHSAASILGLDLEFWKSGNPGPCKSVRAAPDEPQDVSKKGGRFFQRLWVDVQLDQLRPAPFCPGHMRKEETGVFLEKNIPARVDLIPFVADVVVVVVGCRRCRELYKVLPVVRVWEIRVQLKKKEYEVGRCRAGRARCGRYHQKNYLFLLCSDERLANCGKLEKVVNADKGQKPRSFQGAMRSLKNTYIT
ncbi:hypothetical protein QBC38DRAFT_442000 [Podospora fimiseda]|uniref:Uncharacterized protein n=1 Tax=Podospora fimiseda TaxID=252190 RepID=A0AAN7GXV2_9PEZI|nr:hypothetical protein QBC38DRAFT_442000 [Podospora fimiseda]